ncbi:MAG TPA: disulfide bond formation protein B [Candidatus Latescibacteria bacterium]|nr:disulfide bond formation protein B [Candidatus Latescibacterota bacterium]
MAKLEHSLPERPDEKNHGPSFLGLDPDWTLLFLGWLIACISTLGSLFFSYVMEFAPCVLCWYQRICLFPLVIITARGLFPLDRHVIKYALPLAALGWLLAAYHNLLYAELIPADMQPCGKGISCTEEHIELFGFLSIPLLSLISFTTLVSILIILQRRSRK